MVRSITAFLVSRFWRCQRRFQGMDPLGAVILLERKGGVVFAYEMTSRQVEGMRYLETEGLVHPDQSDPDDIRLGAALVSTLVGGAISERLAVDLSEAGQLHWHRRRSCSWETIEQWKLQEAARLRIDPSTYVMDRIDRYLVDRAAAKVA
jgi:hypothetical protein